jgi:hypothetical protein
MIMNRHEAHIVRRSFLAQVRPTTSCSFVVHGPRAA